jgi:hypothetical protein
MPRDMDVTEEVSESSTETQTLDVAPSSVFPDVEADATSSGANDVSEADTLSIVRDVVGGERKDAEEGSSPEGEEAKAEAEVEPKEQDDESYSDVPFAKHPRFKKLLQERNTFKNDAQQYQNVQKFMDTNGISAEEAAEGFTIMALMRSNPAQAWERLKPYVQNLAIAAGEVLPQELVERVNAGEMSHAAAIEYSRTQAKLKSVETHQSFREQQEQRMREQSHAQNLYNTAVAWEADRRAKDPNFEAKLVPLQKELAFLQMQEGKPSTAEGVKDQLKRAYAAVVPPVTAVAAAPTRPRVTTRPSMSGQGNAPAQPQPQTTLEIIRAQRAKG